MNMWHHLAKKLHPLDLSEDRFSQLIIEQPLEKSLKEILFQRIEGLASTGQGNSPAGRAEPDLRLEYCGNMNCAPLAVNTKFFIPSPQR